VVGIAGQLGREAAIGYAKGARLEYVLHPVAFGFGTAIVAMVGTNWGARQHRRARKVAWTGAAVVATFCEVIGWIVAIHPVLWIGQFSDDPDVARLGVLYLRIVGPVYLCFGFGLGLFFVTQSIGGPVAGMNVNAVRLITGAGGGLAAIYWLDLSMAGVFCRCCCRVLSLCMVARPRSVQREGARCHAAKDLLN
jgi:Na+-driven multidrug efflux pump